MHALPVCLLIGLLSVPVVSTAVRAQATPSLKASLAQNPPDQNFPAEQLLAQSGSPGYIPPVGGAAPLPDRDTTDRLNNRINTLQYQQNQLRSSPGSGSGSGSDWLQQRSRAAEQDRLRADQQRLEAERRRLDPTRP
jgi:hypothetical protein